MLWNNIPTSSKVNDVIPKEFAIDLVKLL